MREFVYVLSNKAMPGIVKIGRTSREVGDRVKELNSATGVPAPFVIEHVFATSDSYTLELMIHRDLSPYRVADNREFFKIPLEDAIKHISTTYGTEDHIEELVLLHLKQGKWEYENLPLSKWSGKGRDYEARLQARAEEQRSENQELKRVCKTIVHEVDNYPRELWSPETIEVIEDLDASRMSPRVTTYLHLRDEEEQKRRWIAERPLKRQQLLQEFGYKYVTDENGVEVSPFNLRHPNFHSAIQNKEFLHRWKELEKRE